MHPHQCDKGQGTKTATLSVPRPLQKEVMNLKFQKDAAGWRAGKVCSKGRKQKKITFLGRLEDLWRHLKSVRTEVCLELCRQRETFIWIWGWFRHLLWSYPGTSQPFHTKSLLLCQLWQQWRGCGKLNERKSFPFRHQTPTAFPFQARFETTTVNTVPVVRRCRLIYSSR